MNITLEERLMYKVMEAIYSSGIPVSFKGSMVLKACLMEAGYSDETRHTVDIDANRSQAKTKIYEIEGVLGAIKKNGRELGDFNGFLYRVDELSHSYEKFRFEGDIKKPSFKEVYQAVKNFLGDVLIENISQYGYNSRG